MYVGGKSMKKWTKETAEKYVKYAKEKGLTYWSAVDFLKRHKTMYSIIWKEEYERNNSDRKNK